MIEVGEYVRTHKGDIYKVIGIREELRNGKRVYSHKAYYLDSKKGSLTEAFIVKHSKNIIDLIEEGDIVEMYDVLNEDVIYIWNEEMLKAVKTDVNNGIGIRKILTKEQYEANCYKVKE